MWIQLVSNHKGSKCGGRSRGPAQARIVPKRVLYGETLHFQDILDGLPADTANSQLTELTKDPRVTEIRFRSDVTD